MIGCSGRRPPYVVHRGELALELVSAAQRGLELLAEISGHDGVPCGMDAST